MAHLPVRRKPEPAQAIQMMPMAVVLAIGVGVTVAFEGARKPPQVLAHNFKQEVVQEVVPLAHQQLNQLRQAKILVLAPAAAPAHRTAPTQQAFEVDGRTWVMASHAAVTDFKPDELQFREEIDGWRLVANKQRGLLDMNAKAHAYDRLYLDLGSAGFAPMRWRDVATK